MPKNRIKRPTPLTEGNKFIKDPSLIQIEDLDYPVFCFKHLHKSHDTEQCTDIEKKQFIEKLVQLSKMTWIDIQNTQRHGNGTEKINISSLKKTPPPFITEDVKFLLCIRFDGKKPFLFHRNRFIAHIIFIDNKFSVYPH